MYIFDVPTSVKGGAQTSMQIIINNLNKEFDFICITPEQKKILKNHIILKGYDSFFNVKSFHKKIKLIFLIRYWINKLRPDIIHIQMPRSLTIINILKKYKLIDNSIKIIFTDRHVYNKYDYKMVSRIKELDSHLEYIITTTHYNKTLYLQDLSIKTKVEVIPNTAGSEFEEYDSSLRSYFREKYNIKETNLVISFCGRVSEDKNWPLAIQLIKELHLIKKYEIKVALCLATDNSSENKNEAIKIINEFEETLGDNNVIHFIDMDFKEMPNFYYLSDCLIITSKVESFGRTAIEAMSRKNIVFSTNIDGVAEVINYEDYLFSTKEEFLVKFEKCFFYKEKIQREKEKFYKRFNELYCLECNVNRYKLLYNRITN